MNQTNKRRLLYFSGIALLLVTPVPLAKFFGAPGMVLWLVMLFCFVLMDSIARSHDLPSPWKVDRSTSTAHTSHSPIEHISYEVQFDDLEVRVLHNGEVRERAAWADVQTVKVETWNSFVPQPWVALLTGARSGCMYPCEATGSDAMAAELRRRLPGFDHAALAEAWGMEEGEEATAWTNLKSSE